MFVISICTGAGVAHKHDLNPVLPAKQNTPDYNDYYYPKPYVRIGPFALGVGLAFLIYTYNQYQKRGRVYDHCALAVSKFINRFNLAQLSCYVIGLGLMSSIIFGQFDAWKDTEN
jgi:hypothetical protein